MMSLKKKVGSVHKSKMFFPQGKKYSAIVFNQHCTCVRQEGSEGSEPAGLPKGVEEV
jgi:hypothetical protein